MFSTAARRRLSPALAALVLGAWWTAATLHAQPPHASLFRVFLSEGGALVSYGEFARVGDRVVLSVPLGDTPETLKLQLVSIPANAVDWTQTDAYANAVRAARYAETRGEEDFALLAARVTSALNDIHLAPDPARRRAMAEEARRNLAAWPAANYGYRAGEVAQFVAALDEVIAGMDTGSGEGFSLSLVSTPGPPPPVDLLPPPDVRGSLEAAVRAAQLAVDPAERIALLRVLTQELAFAPRTAEWAAPLRARAAAALETELAVERSYAGLAAGALRDAGAAAARGDIRGLQQVIQRVLSGDARLGSRRPGEIAALLATLDLRMDEARRVRAARDAWAARLELIREYRRAIAAPRRRIAELTVPLQRVRERARIGVPLLQRTERRASAALRALALVRPPTEAETVHALYTSALQLARQAAALRQGAISSGTAKLAWDASSAAAGALLLAGRAADELDDLLARPPSTSR